MAKRKDPNSAGIGKEESLIWNRTVDSFLIDAFVHQNEIGNQVGGTFTSKAYENIVKELSKRFTGKRFDKEHIKNCIKYIKRGFGPCYDIFKNGLSGFSWDPVSSMWCAEPEVWDKLVEAHPDAALWRNKPIANYEKLLCLYGTDRAIGEEAETPAEIRERERNLRQINQHYTIEEVDQLVSNEEAILESHTTFTNENSPSLDRQPEGNSSNKKIKTKKSKDDDILILKESFQTVADAILKSTNDLVKSQPMPLMPTSEIWNMLEEIGVDGPERKKTYIFLATNPNMLNVFLGYPVSESKELLEFIPFN